MTSQRDSSVSSPYSTALCLPTPPSTKYLVGQTSTLLLDDSATGLNSQPLFGSFPGSLPKETRLSGVGNGNLGTSRKAAGSSGYIATCIRNFTTLTRHSIL